MHDIDAVKDIKIVKMMADYGYIGFGYYWAIVSELYRNGGRYSFEDLHILSREIGIDKSKLKSFLNQSIEKYTHNGNGLFATDGEYFWSESILKRLNPKKKKEKPKEFMTFEDIKCVHLLEDDYNVLCDKYGRDVVDTGIKILDNWLSLGGKKAKSYLGKDFNHINHFRKDGWVINTAKEKLSKTTSPVYEAPSQEELIRKLNLCK